MASKETDLASKLRNLLFYIDGNTLVIEDSDLITQNTQKDLKIPKQIKIMVNQHQLSVKKGTERDYCNILTQILHVDAILPDLFRKYIKIKPNQLSTESERDQEERKIYSHRSIGSDAPIFNPIPILTPTSNPPPQQYRSREFKINNTVYIAEDLPLTQQYVKKKIIDIKQKPDNQPHLNQVNKAETKQNSANSPKLYRESLVAPKHNEKLVIQLSNNQLPPPPKVAESTTLPPPPTNTSLPPPPKITNLPPPPKEMNLPPPPSTSTFSSLPPPPPMNTVLPPPPTNISHQLPPPPKFEPISGQPHRENPLPQLSLNDISYGNKEQASPNSPHPPVVTFDFIPTKPPENKPLLSKLKYSTLEDSPKAPDLPLDAVEVNLDQPKFSPVQLNDSATNSHTLPPKMYRSKIPNHENNPEARRKVLYTKFNPPPYLESGPMSFSPKLNNNYSRLQMTVVSNASQSMYDYEKEGLHSHIPQRKPLIDPSFVLTSPHADVVIKPQDIIPSEPEKAVQEIISTINNFENPGTEKPSEIQKLISKGRKKIIPEKKHEWEIKVKEAAFIEVQTILKNSLCLNTPINIKSVTFSTY